MFLSQTKSLRFPLWHYLNQPLFSPSVAFVLNPQLFWKYYRIEHLSRCWHRECSKKGNSHS